MDADDFDLEYDEEGTSKMNLKALGTLAMCGVFGHANDEFKDGRYPTAKERQLMRRFVDAVASVGFGAALRLTAGKVWSLEREREKPRDSNRFRREQSSRKREEETSEQELRIGRFSDEVSISQRRQ